MFLKVMGPGLTMQQCIKQPDAGCAFCWSHQPQHPVHHASLIGGQPWRNHSSLYPSGPVATGRTRRSAESGNDKNCGWGKIVRRARKEPNGIENNIWLLRVSTPVLRPHQHKMSPSHGKREHEWWITLLHRFRVRSTSPTLRSKIVDLIGKLSVRACKWSGVAATLNKTSAFRGP